MRILISNDDGYNSLGIKQLAKHLSDIAEIIIVAPTYNQSACSSSLTVKEPLRPIKISKNCYAVDGTSADCAHLALCGFIKEPIDLVVSGINAGANLGDDVIYSGTIAAAIEGRFLDIPSIAISLTDFNPDDFTDAAIISTQIVKQIYQAPIPAKTILNINIPNIPLTEIKGIKSTHLGTRKQSAPNFKDKNDPSAYFIGDNGIEDYNSEGTDFHAVNNNYVSVTPLNTDLTDYSLLNPTQNWLDGISY